MYFFMITEQMTISKALKVKKELAKEIIEFTSKKEEPLFISYDKSEPYTQFTCSPDEKEQQILSNFQRINSLINRYNALCNALIEANATTMVKVPKFASLDKILKNPDTVEIEEISIAQAINRKDFYKDKYKGKIMACLAISYKKSIKNDSDVRDDVKQTIKNELDRRFPITYDGNKSNNWSDSKYTEAKESLEKDHEVVSIDPLNLIPAGGFQKVIDYINSYLIEIDDILNVANVTTTIEFSY